MSDVEKVLERAGLEFETLDSGCCGLAGSFGYERQHYEIAMQIGERALLPAVRDAAEDALVVADGFSCRQQIAHGTERRALHLAQVLQLGLREGATTGPTR
jgi:Fe-S oxidoreductase